MEKSSDPTPRSRTFPQKAFDILSGFGLATILLLLLGLLTWFATLEQIDKVHGKGSIIRLGEVGKSDVGSISTGSPSLDLAIGIGGRTGRPVPRCLPVRIVAMNCASVHAPIPEACGVRLAA